MILNRYKPLGITSYDVIRQLKKKYPGQKIGHAGTLDPLAEGVLICLVGKDATQRQSEFMNVTKEYEFDVLFGFETDTYDILGIVKNYLKYEVDEVLGSVPQHLFAGEINQPVPPFSAVKIKGKPLYRWYLDGKINEVDIPIKTVNIEAIEIIGSRTITKDDLRSEIFLLLDKVRSGFRQSIVNDKWTEIFNSNINESFLVVRIKAVVSKGTYVRAIAHDLGQKLGVGACTLTIKRTKVGDFKIENSERQSDH